MVAPPSNLSQKDRRALFVLVIVVTSLTALHYYHQIKLTRMKIKELEEDNGT
jgi:hypothetical protein